MNFKDLGLIEPILKALENEGHSQPFPIQEQAIPHILEGKDLLGFAQTGTGKTAAFALPIIQYLVQNEKRDTKTGNVRALILTPTRELAIQIRDNFRKYGIFTNLKCSVIFGGVNQRSQVELLQKGVDILVATPGRLLDLVMQKHAKLGALEVLVLDEADTMLDMGFINYVKKIISYIKEDKQTLMFSATMANSITELANDFLKDHVTVKINSESPTVDKINQSLYYVDKANKTKLLIDILNNEDIKSVLIFTRTKHGANKLSEALEKNGIDSGVIHGNKSQSARIQALNDFKSGKSKILVATDVAARGIDIIELSHVINYEMPDQAEAYIHRIGRTGRAGLSGKAISFCNVDEKGNLRDIQRLIKREIDVVEKHNYPMEQLTLSPKESDRERFNNKQRSRNNFSNNNCSQQGKDKNKEKRSLNNKKRRDFKTFSFDQNKRKEEKSFNDKSRDDHKMSFQKPKSKNANYLERLLPSSFDQRKKQNRKKFNNNRNHSQGNRWNKQKRNYL